MKVYQKINKIMQNYWKVNQFVYWNEKSITFLEQATSEKWLEWFQMIFRVYCKLICSIIHKTGFDKTCI